ncbi:MAG TPA: IMP cyclohydrolase [Candidatus Hydrogenedens sp.]|nr:IMP cyclohydrolase [Candidatus Hydrogenedens sp.]HOK09426.1 IMP cyclohydrolase [Candidatus Hydrogenedens sp.]HOL18983.1 IMP cyclohydrolase [Candidatus Hydrogenedens sp.]HPP58965.1 IMP cyclohydrolase [Candidatus Hydrogenedens sp.]
MYIGRIVSVAQTEDGRLCAMYRVSSRSFPNRQAVLGKNKVTITPLAGHEADLQKNPYISYNCLKSVLDGEVAVLSNGSHTDPIAEKIINGMPTRDAIALTLIALDFEKDDYATPRIVAVIDKAEGSGWLGIVRSDGLEVCRMDLKPGRFFYVATYEENYISSCHGGVFPALTAEEACAFILGGGVFSERTHPITAVSAMATDEGFDIAIQNSPVYAK